jgi:hypothetical protein
MASMPVAVIKCQRYDKRFYNTLKDYMGGPTAGECEQANNAKFMFDQPSVQRIVNHLRQRGFVTFDGEHVTIADVRVSHVFVAADQCQVVMDKLLQIPRTLRICPCVVGQFTVPAATYMTECSVA